MQKISEEQLEILRLAAKAGEFYTATDVDDYKDVKALERLGRMFAETMEACGIKGTSFHEVRGLGKTLMQEQGYALEDIRDLMAHEDISTTAAYGDPSKIPYKRVTLKQKIKEAG